MKFWNLMGGSLSAIALSVAVSAQPTPPTCTVAPATVTNFSLERVLTTQSLLTALAPTISPSVVTAVANGSLEVRERLIYNPQQNTLTATEFLIPSGSANPTPLGVDITGGTLQTFVITIDKIYTSCQPAPSVMFVGLVSSSSGGQGVQNGPFGSFQGAPAAVSVGYTTDNPPKVNNVVTLIGGRIATFSVSALGSLTFPVVPVVTPGTATPTAVIGLGSPSVAATAAIPVNQIFFNPFQLDASLSKDPGGSALTYLWTSDKPAQFLPNPTVANPLIQFQSGAEDYKITLTVTNAAGVSTMTSTILSYIGRSGR